MQARIIQISGACVYIVRHRMCTTHSKLVFTNIVRWFESECGFYDVESHLSKVGISDVPCWFSCWSFNGEDVELFAGEVCWCVVDVWQKSATRYFGWIVQRFLLKLFCVYSKHMTSKWGWRVQRWKLFFLFCVSVFLGLRVSVHLKGFKVPSLDTAIQMLLIWIRSRASIIISIIPASILHTNNKDFGRLD